jgi:hypothetical protein
MHLTYVDQKFKILKIADKRVHPLQKTQPSAKNSPKKLCHVIKLGKYCIIILSEYVEPICLDTFNDSRECLFKGDNIFLFIADGNMYNCKDFLK